MEGKRYNVYIINIGKFKASENAGEDILEKDVHGQITAVERRVNLLDYFVDAYLVGSERDLECKADLK